MADTFTLEGIITAQTDLALKVVGDTGASATHRSDTEKLRHIGTIGHGAGDNLANDYFEAEIVIANTANPEFIDLSGATEANRYGIDLAWAKLKGWFVKAAADNEATATVTVGGGEHPVIASNEPIPPGGSKMAQYPIQATAPAVAAGATDKFHLVNNDAVNPATVTVCLWGEKAV